MFCTRVSDPATAWQGGRRRALFELTVEHCFWTSWDGESACEDHDWRGGSVYVDSTHTRIVDIERLAVSVANGQCAGSDSDANSGATSFTGSTCSITCGESVALS